MCTFRCIYAWWLCKYVENFTCLINNSNVGWYLKIYYNNNYFVLEYKRNNDHRLTRFVLTKRINWTRSSQFRHVGYVFICGCLYSRGILRTIAYTNLFTNESIENIIIYLTDRIHIEFSHRFLCNCLYQSRV